MDPVSSRVARTLPTLCLFALIAALLGLAELSPRRFERLMQEDGWGEWATFCAFALAAGIALRALFSSMTRVRLSALERLALLGLAAFCGFVAGEEISWGQRLFGFRPATVFLEQNYQQESNLHNLLKDVLDTRWMVFAICASYGVLAPYLSLVTRFPRALAAPLALLPWFACAAWLEFSYPYELVGELAELLLGLLLLEDVLMRTSARVRTDQRAWVAGAQLAACGLALAIVPLTELALQRDAGALVARTRSDLSVLAQRIEQGETLRAKLFRKREVHKRVYTAVKEGYLELDPEQFYLDAWNNPYWVAFERKDAQRGNMILYSFGPNRRRDLDPKQRGERAHAGDDVKIELEIRAPVRAER